jgi:hypothetical protein
MSTGVDAMRSPEEQFADRLAQAVGWLIEDSPKPFVQRLVIEFQAHPGMLDPMAAYVLHLDLAMHTEHPPRPRSWLFATLRRFSALAVPPDVLYHYDPTHQTTPPSVAFRNVGERLLADRFADLIDAWMRPYLAAQHPSEPSVYALGATPGMALTTVAPFPLAPVPPPPAAAAPSIPIALTLPTMPPPSAPALDAGFVLHLMQDCIDVNLEAPRTLARLAREQIVLAYRTLPDIPSGTADDERARLQKERHRRAELSAVAVEQEAMTWIEDQHGAGWQEHLAIRAQDTAAEPLPTTPPRLWEAYRRVTDAAAIEIYVEAVRETFQARLMRYLAGQPDPPPEPPSPVAAIPATLPPPPSEDDFLR